MRVHVSEALERARPQAVAHAPTIVTTSIAGRLARLGSPPWPVVCLTLCFWNALLAVVLGKEMNWDLLNYHFYNGYAVLTGRLGLDVAPAQVQTFLNPLLDVPLYLAMVSMPPLLVGAAYGFVQGLNGVAAWLVARAALPIEDRRRREWVAFGLGALGGLGTINVSQAGGSMGDTLVSIPMLFSVAVLLGKQQRLETAPSPVVIGWAGLAGAISGIGVGLKISSVLCSAGFAVGCLFLVRALDRRVLVAIAFGVGTVGGWLLLSGFWLWQMWSRFGDPLFPFLRLLNSRSEFVGVLASRDTRFLPTSATSAALYPFVWAFDSGAVSEARFRDWHFAVLYLLLAVMGARWCVRRWNQGWPVRQVPASGPAFLLVGGLASYVMWLFTFGVYRYLAPLEWLAPLGITLALMSLVRPPYRTVTIVAVLALVTVTTRPANWGRAGWTESYFGVTAPQLEPGTSPMVLIAGLNGLSFLVPHFPADVRFVRLQSNSFLYGMALGGFYGEGAAPNHFDKLVRDAVESHEGRIYVMVDGLRARPEDRSAFAGAYDLDAVLWKLRLQVRADSCQPVRMTDLPPPPWASLRHAYVQPPLMPSTSICATTRGATLFQSPVFQGAAAPIARLYFAYFHRIPDAEGLERRLAQSKAGMSLSAMSEAFARSDEFRSRQEPLSNEQFVTLVYRNVLGREPDSNGFAHWVGQLGAGALGRAQMMLEFAESTEHVRMFSSSLGP